MFCLIPIHSTPAFSLVPLQYFSSNGRLRIFPETWQSPKEGTRHEEVLEIQRHRQHQLPRLPQFKRRSPEHGCRADLQQEEYDHHDRRHRQRPGRPLAKRPMGRLLVLLASVACSIVKGCAVCLKAGTFFPCAGGCNLVAMTSEGLQVRG